jgi:hypothetical protein
MEFGLSKSETIHTGFETLCHLKIEMKTTMNGTSALHSSSCVSSISKRKNMIAHTVVILNQNWFIDLLSLITFNKVFHESNLGIGMSSFVINNKATRRAETNLIQTQHTKVSVILFFSFEQSIGLH